MRHSENHRIGRISWLRASVLGANDGIVSTASLVVGVAAADASREGILVAGVAGLVAGAMSMAAGEFVSVSSEADAEAADLERERGELAANPAAEARELASIYESRGLDAKLAATVAEVLMRHDALSAHARDELGIFPGATARPLLAAASSAAAFVVGAAVPLATAVAVPAHWTVSVVSVASLLCLALLGGLAARAGRAPLGPAIARVTVWGAIAMAVTAAVGMLFNAAV